MEKRSKIVEYRERLDKTLASSDLKHKPTLRKLVTNQLRSSSQQDRNEGCNENAIEKRTGQVSNFLDMLRSVSTNENGQENKWKLKQDNEEFRVMYREGPKGTPFHTLLVEGYVDGPADVCLCVSWESDLYKKWWPQTSIPPFKILSSKCVQRVQIGEQISLVRMKVPWPLSGREALINYFVFEYIQDDLIIILLNSISDSDGINKNTNYVIPESTDMIRIDLVGGYALQKVTPDRSYFRTIANMDIKLDFLPPWLINFVSRQLVGSGFRLYQKVVASSFKSDVDFITALRDPLYTQIHDSLYVRKEKIETKNLEEKDYVHEILDHPRQNQNGLNDLDRKVFSEIEEEESVNKNVMISTEKISRTYHKNSTNDFVIGLEVQKALGTLDKVINMIRGDRNAQTGSNFIGSIKEEPLDFGKNVVRNTLERVSDDPTHNIKIFSGSLREDVIVSNKKGQIKSFESPIQKAMTRDESLQYDENMNNRISNLHENSRRREIELMKRKRAPFCCFFGRF